MAEFLCLVKVARNTDYWKPDRPYLDGIEYTIIRRRSTANLAFIAGKFDLPAGLVRVTSWSSIPARP
jgi:ABC-type transport system substrate-binding protein